MPPRRSVADKNRYYKLRNDGHSINQACQAIGIAFQTGQSWERNLKDSSGRAYAERRAIRLIGEPIPHDALKPEPRQALDDFEFFRRRYFGRISSPWQVDAAEKFVAALATPEKEYIVLNCPPGSGKSTLLHDIEAWLTVRNRRIRGIVGSATQRNSVAYLLRLRRTLERPRPAQPDPDDIAAGRAVVPTCSLTQEFGRFQPDSHDLWRQEEFIVAQYEDVAIGEKEPTWQCFGLDTEYLGNRVDIAVWDDVVTKKVMRTVDSIEKQRDKWDDEAETRIEPGGALFLVGQRLGASDLYRYNLDKPSEDFVEEDDDDDDDELVEPMLIEPEGSHHARMYHRIVYPAHDESRCVENHSSKTPRYWSPSDPQACLLDPVRLSWKDLKRIQLHRNEKYRTVYQQEDVDASQVLVPRHYITGGEINGETFPGCYDTDRGLHEVPKGLNSDALSIVTVDPSPTQFWAVEWWLYDKTSELRHLMDIVRMKLDASQFLDYDYAAREFTGVLEDLWQVSNKRGRPIRYLIVERNGAQRFLLQFDHFKRWQQLRGVSVFPHDTMGNKTDPEFGVQTIAAHYRFGRIRLPNSQRHGDLGFIATRMLVQEVTVWPDGMTDDCVMAHWFLEWWLPRISTPDIPDIDLSRRPHWLGTGWRRAS